MRTELRTAAHHAAEAATRAEVDIRLLTEVSEVRETSRLFVDIWGVGSDGAQLPPDVLRALVHAGNYAAGAFVNERLVGAVVGFLGTDNDGTYLHSHILGVSAQHRGGHIGFALKQHQRAWALEHDLRKVTWTFDPLVRRNAYFNLQKLGADAAAYHESFYGQMTDGINAGDESDRLLVVWELDTARVAEAASGHLPDPSSDDLLSSGASVALSEDARGRPQARPVSGATALCVTPENIVNLRKEDVQTALSWRKALRETLGHAMQDGYRVSGFTRTGWYVLSREADHE
jgi:predicted GNAT superfamily acetyltransferase